MRTLRLLLVSVILSLVVVTPSRADPGQGTVITRGSDWSFGYYWNDYTITKVAVFSSDPQFLTSWFCDGQWPPVQAADWMNADYLWLWVASQKQNGWFGGPMFTRVYQTAEPPADDAAWCAMLSGQSAPLVAEGISEFKWNDLNTCNWGPGKNTWYPRAVGNLTAPSCPSGMTHFNMEFHYQLAPGTPSPVPPDCSIDPAAIRALVIRGPDLKCTGRK
jgi:hypothetical protein